MVSWSLDFADEVVEENLERGLEVADGILHGLEVGLDFEDELGEGAAMFGRERVKERDGLLLEGAAASGDVGQVRHQLAGMWVSSKAELGQLFGELGLQFYDVLGFGVGHR